VGVGWGGGGGGGGGGRRDRYGKIHCIVFGQVRDKIHSRKSRRWRQFQIRPFGRLRVTLIDSQSISFVRTQRNPFRLWKTETKAVARIWENRTRGKPIIKLLLLHPVGCLYYCINDAQLHNHQIQKHSR